MQIGKVAYVRGDAGQAVVLNVQGLQIGKVAYVRGDATRQLVAVKDQGLQIGEIAQLRGDRAIKIALTEVQLCYTRAGDGDALPLV